MLFEIHNEGKIAFKRLTDADLKRSSQSNQTHIGLSNDSLTFMPDNKREYRAMLIYNNYCDIVKGEVGRIRRKSGKYEAPNLKTGGKGSNSAVRKIREFAAEKSDKKFYLLWFGLDSGTPAFWLICEGSPDYNNLNQFCHFNDLHDRYIKVLNASSDEYSSILQYTTYRLEHVSIELQKDLEISAEVENDNPKFKTADVSKAKSYIQQLGRAGEEMINAYLDREKHAKRVRTYDWANQSSEVGNPYDFYIQYEDGRNQWIDVKTTEHGFDQAIIVSRNEIRFITEKPDTDYAIFRVYSKSETEAKLKICSGCLKYVRKLQRDIDYITQSMKDYRASIMNYKIAFEPGDHCFNSISQELRLC